MEIRAKLINIVEPVLEDAGYELVDLTFIVERDGWVLRIFIDTPPDVDSGISFSDCERVSRELGAVLDVEDPIEQAYKLEVSSPGVDRPLRRAEHFRRQLGETVKARLCEGIDGRRNFKGTIVAVQPTERAEDSSADADDAQAVVILEVDGKEYSLPVADLESARLVPDWDRLMKASLSGKSDPAHKGPAQRGTR